MNNLLFPNSPDILSRKLVIELLSPHFEDISGCVRDGWNQWVQFGENDPESRKPLNATFRASFVYQHIVESAKRRFLGIGSVALSEQDKYLRLVFYDKAVIRFKKLNDEFHSSGIPTCQRLDYTRQISIEGYERTNLIVGYRLDESQTQIYDINMICPINERKNLWTYELQSSADSIIPIENHPVNSDETAKVIAKGRKIRKGIAE